MSQVKEGDQVKVHYTGKLTDGTVFDSSENREPLAFTVGAGQMIPGFDKAIPGMAVGDTKTIEVVSAEAYGDRRDDLIVTVPSDKLPEDMNPTVGDKLQINQEDGRAIPVTVTEVKDDSIILDANHDLAGKDLVFDVELVEIV